MASSEMDMRFRVLEKCWVVVNLGYWTSPWRLVEDQEVLGAEAAQVIC